MKSFGHINSKSIDEAVEALEEYKENVRIIAGGTDLIGTLKDNIHAAYPELLLNIKKIRNLDYIREDDEGLKIGALTKLHAIETDAIIKEKFRVLAEAAHSIASPQIRRMGTIGGNLCQEPRCWYYRNPENTFYCTRKGGNYCNALTGENRYHSIFGAAKVGMTPCAFNCPGTADIPAYLSKIQEGHLIDAARILLGRNPIPAITGRVCPHFCEENCNRGEYDESLSIRNIERFMGDYILENPNNIITLPDEESGKHVAVIGSGPAGLSAAYYLKMLGHGVTVFDRMEEAGGMLFYGIPPYRLPKRVVRRVAKMIENMGVGFRFKTQIGKDVSLEDIYRKFDSLFLASGTWNQPSIGLKGEELTISGLRFLNEVNRGVKPILGKRVVVIGGGSVAVDVGVTAIRLGAREVTLICLESREEMPAYKQELKQAVEESVKIMPSWGPSKVLESEGKITGLELVRCISVFDEEGHFSPRYDENTREKMEADQVFLAVGQTADLSYIDPSLFLKVDQGLIKVDKASQGTNVKGLFAGGDAVNGPSTVIEAIASGRKAAEAMDCYLRGITPVTKQKSIKPDNCILKFDPKVLKKSNRVKTQQLPRSERRVDVEDELGLSSSDMELEVSRCFNCGCVAVNPSDIAPALIALEAQIKTTKRIADAEDFFDVRTMKSTILDEDELITEIRIPKQKPKSISGYSKFRLRKTIDFPIVGIASIFRMIGKTVEDARIVIGAVAPIPLRIKAAEDYLKGREITDEVSKEAARIAVKDTTPLANNVYKVQITKALIKRAILRAAK